MSNFVEKWYEDKNNVDEMLNWNSELKDWEKSVIKHFPSGARILDMDKKKAFDKSKNVVSLFLRVRWWFKVFLAFGTGVWTGMWTYRKVHVQPGWSKPGAIGFAILKGVVATAFTLLVLLAIRALIRLLIKSVKHMAAKIQKGGRTTEEVRPDEGNKGKCETREDIS